MKFLSLEPFIPSGSNFDASKNLFQALGFKISWDVGDFIGFEKDACRFVLQNYNHIEFAQNLMLTVKVDSAAEFWKFVTEQQLAEKFGIKISKPTQQPYGIEVNIIDIAGVCWHFVE
jgi:hypothetical protein